MCESFDVRSASGNYSVSIQEGGFADYLAGQEHCVVFADEFFKDLLSPLRASQHTFFYEASESIKSLEAIPALIERLRRSGVNRQTRLVAVGGGTIQDLTGFVASIYMRGVEWTYVPTTILGMVDSCIGGKSAINAGLYKNLVGTFHPPTEIFIDPQITRTLPVDHRAGGLVEAAKICFCHGPDCFRNYLDCNPHPESDLLTLKAVISRSLSAKKWFVEVDEFDQKERLLLNFGHTFGHAIEGASNYGVSHGTAVGLGILCALAFGRRNSQESGDTCAQAPDVSELENHLHLLLRTMPGLPRRIAAMRINEILERFGTDKKHKQDCYVLILVDRSGKAVASEIEKSAGSRQRIREAIESVFETCVR